jgi:hypothetical protein
LSLQEEFDQCHEAEVLMELDMTMKQREAVIVRGEVNLGAPGARNIDYILEYAGGWLAGDSCKFESMPVHIYGMSVSVWWSRISR